jgi:hypothetical protein
LVATLSQLPLEWRPIKTVVNVDSTSNTLDLTFWLTPPTAAALGLILTNFSKDKFTI